MVKLYSAKDSEFGKVVGLEVDGFLVCDRDSIRSPKYGIRVPVGFCRSVGWAY